MKTQNIISKHTLGIAAAVAALGIAAGPSFATITAWQPAVLKIAPPPAVTLGALQSNVNIHAFDERQCFQLPAALQTDHGWIPQNTWVSCHIFHVDPVTFTTLDGPARFDADIIDGISSSALLDASDPVCGVPATSYPAAGVEVNRGFEAFQLDGYRLLDPRTVEMRMEVPADSYSDQLRVITHCCPDGMVCD